MSWLISSTKIDCLIFLFKFHVSQKTFFTTFFFFVVARTKHKKECLEEEAKNIPDFEDNVNLRISFAVINTRSENYITFIIIYFCLTEIYQKYILFINIFFEENKNKKKMEEFLFNAISLACLTWIRQSVTS